MPGYGYAWVWSHYTPTLERDVCPRRTRDESHVAPARRTTRLRRGHEGPSTPHVQSLCKRAMPDGVVTVWQIISNPGVRMNQDELIPADEAREEQQYLGTWLS